METIALIGHEYSWMTLINCQGSSRRPCPLCLIYCIMLNADQVESSSCPLASMRHIKWYPVHPTWDYSSMMSLHNKGMNQSREYWHWGWGKGREGGRDSIRVDSNQIRQADWMNNQWMIRVWFEYAAKSLAEPDQEQLGRSPPGGGAQSQSADSTSNESLIETLFQHATINES